MSPINFGWTWRNFQLVWWGWRWSLPLMTTVRFERAREPLDSVYRWMLFIGPVEVRRWAEDWRDQHRRLGVLP